VPPKCELSKVLSKYAFFQYCDSNIGFVSLAPFKVIALNLLCLIYGTSSLLLVLIAFSKVIALSAIAIAILVALSRSYRR